MSKRHQAHEHTEGPVSSRPERRKLEHQDSQGTSSHLEKKFHPTHSPYPNKDYRVGWICALPTEMAAAKGMMDEEHGVLQTAPQVADHNTYLLGCIGKFKVVVACLPKDEIGSSPAAAVAKDMLFTFPNLKFGLFVGTGAGIPNYESDDIQDVRLGDVVIGTDKENGGVVLYDFGKRLADGSFKSMYALDRPPRPLRTAISLLEAQHQTRENRISQYISEMLERYPYMIKKRFNHLGQSADQLFRADYCQVSGSSCAECDPAHRIDRYPETRPDTDPVIHYGIIATGSAVVKHAPTRVEIRQKHRAICLEMEAAGLMHSFPCVVIRGISNYADSHKNDQWQPYAAAVAAGCAKELLEYVQPKVADLERTVKDMFNILNRVSDSQSRIKKEMNAHRNTEILDWLTPVDYGPQQSDLFSGCQTGTGHWFLNSEKFQAWLSNSKQTLFCPGMPGAGKAMITSIVVDHLQRKFENSTDIGIAYLYCNFKRQHEQRPADLLLSLLNQLVQERSSISESVKSLCDRHKTKGTRPSLKEISNALYSIVTEFSTVFILVDALDECQVSNGDRTELLAEIFSLQAKATVNLFMTSQSTLEIEKEFEG